MKNLMVKALTPNCVLVVEGWPTTVVDGAWVKCECIGMYVSVCVLAHVHMCFCVYVCVHAYLLIHV